MRIVIRKVVKGCERYLVKEVVTKEAVRECDNFLTTSRIFSQQIFENVSKEAEES